VNAYVKKMWKLGYPIILGNLGLVLMGIIDNAMVGEVSYNDLAACGISVSLFFIITIFGMGVLMVTSALIAERQVNNSQEVEKLNRSVLTANWIITALTFVSLLFTAEHFHLFKQEPIVEELAVPYFKIISWSVWPMFLFLAFKNMADGRGHTRASMFATLSAVGLNVFLNWVFIYGNLGVEAYGLNGAGYATFLSRLYMGLFVLIYVIQSSAIQFTWRGLIPIWDTTELWRIFKIGVPSGMQFFFEVTAFALAAVMAGILSAASLAAHQVVIGLASFTYMFSGGLSTASMLLIGEKMADREWREIQEIGRVGLKITVVAMAIFSMVFILGRHALPGWFTNDEPVLVLTAGLMVIAAFFQLFDGVQAVSLGFLRGLSDTLIPSIYTFVIYWVITIPMSFVLGFTFDMGLNGIWMGLTIGLILASIILYRRFRNRVSREINSLQELDGLHETKLT
jgi:MATE family multidrug resistance protein